MHVITLNDLRQERSIGRKHLSAFREEIFLSKNLAVGWKKNGGGGGGGELLKRKESSL